MKILNNAIPPLFLVAVMLTSCNRFSLPTISPTDAIETVMSSVKTAIVETQTAIPTATLTALPLPPATPLPPTVVAVQRQVIATKIQLPFKEKSFEGDYCQYPSVKLSTSDAQGLTVSEIARELMELHLSYFHAPQAPDWCRVDGYKIDKVFYDERTPYLPLEPKGDFMRAVYYSIKLIQIPNMWMSHSGEIDQQNWLHTGANLAIFRLEDGYTIKFANP